MYTPYEVRRETSPSRNGKFKTFKMAGGDVVEDF